MYDSAENNNPLHRQEFFFWCCAVAALLALLGRAAFFGAETRIAEAAREAGEFGRWWPLCVNFRPFSGLPLLEAWSIAAMRSGGGIGEFAGRLPSALAALALLGGVRQLAVTLFDRRTALVAGWLTLGSCGVLYLGRCSGSGVLTCALTVWAVAVYCHSRSAGRRGFSSTLAVGLLLALAAANDGWSALLVASALLAPWLYRYREAPKSGRWRTWLALLLTLAALYLSFRWLFRDPVLIAADFLKLLVRGDGRGGWEFVKQLYGVRRAPLWAGFYNLPRVILPWTLIAFAGVAAAICRHRTLSRDELALLTGCGFGFAVLGLLPGTTWPDYLVIVPFLALGSSVELLGENAARWTLWSVTATRGVIVLLAALAAVSPVALPMWKQLLGFDLPTVFLAACPLAGFLVLAVMLFDSHPSKPFSLLSGLPASMTSTILGGTLLTICLISFLIPSLRELRAEKPFLRKLKSGTAGIEPKSFVYIGGKSAAAVFLFYTRMPGEITVIDDIEKDFEKACLLFAGAIAANSGGPVAVVTRCRNERELNFLRECVKAGIVKLDVDRPTLREATQPGGAGTDRLLACWLINAPSGGSAGSTHVQNKGN